MDSSKHQAKNTDNLYQVFHCFICMERVKNAHLCPNCSKLCCFHCINRWLMEKSHCPHCRHRLQLSDLVNCRWAEDFAKQYEQSKRVTPHGLVKDMKIIDDNGTEKRIIDMCPDHNEKVNVYCWTCRCCICHQCALWSGKHSGHTFKPLDEIYDLFSSNLRASLNRLRSRYMQLNLLATRRRKNVHRSISEKNDAYRDLHSKMNSIIDNFECKVENEIFELIAKQVEIDNEVEMVDNLALNIERNLNVFTQAELIISSKSFENRIDDILNKPVQRLNNVAVDFSNELVPSYEQCTFLLKNYSLLQRRAYPVFSESMHVNGLCWRLKLYPDGNGVSRGSYLSLFIELNYGPKGPLKYEYRVEMINQSPCGNGENFVREFTSEFDNEESWGYNRFFRIESLQTEGFLDPVTDTLKFRLYIRNPNYCDKTRDQAWFMNEMMQLISSPVYLNGSNFETGLIDDNLNESPNETNDNNTANTTANTTITDDDNDDSAHDNESGRESSNSVTATTVQPVHQCDRNCRSYARACCRRLFHFNDILIFGFLDSEPNREMAQTQQPQQLHDSSTTAVTSNTARGHYGAIGSGRSESTNDPATYSIDSSGHTSSTLASARELRRRLRRYAPGSQNRRRNRTDDDDEDDDDDYNNDDNGDRRGADDYGNDDNDDDDDGDHGDDITMMNISVGTDSRIYDNENIVEHDEGELSLINSFYSLSFGSDPTILNVSGGGSSGEATAHQSDVAAASTSLSSSSSTSSSTRSRRRNRSRRPQSTTTGQFMPNEYFEKLHLFQSMQSKYPNFCRKCLQATTANDVPTNHPASNTHAVSTPCSTAATAATSPQTSSSVPSAFSSPNKFFVRLIDE